MKTILVPTDFSIPADDAIHYAVKLAKVLNASIILYHSFIPFESGFYPLAQSNKENLETEKKLTDRLTTIKNHILKSNNDIPVEVQVERGAESLRITKFCKKNKINLIVMGTKGASGLKEALIGSFTADVMTNAPCMVLAIPLKCKFKMPKKITYLSNYGKNEMRAIKTLAELNTFFQADINILHIDNKEDKAESEKKFNKYKKKMETKFTDTHLSFQHIAGNKIPKDIILVTLNDKTDLLVISPIKRKGIWKGLFHKRITKTIAYHSQIPLLAIPLH